MKGDARADAVAVAAATASAEADTAVEEDATADTAVVRDETDRVVEEDAEAVTFSNRFRVVQKEKPRLGESQVQNRPQRYRKCGGSGSRSESTRT
jgi:hypothetical protein